MACLDSVRLLLALASSSGWSVHHMDMKSTFLNGELEDDFYVIEPPGLATIRKEHLVLRLNKALYGLK